MKKTPYVRNKLKELKINKENVDIAYKEIRQYQKSIPHRKTNIIENLTKSIDDIYSESKKEEVKKILKQYSYDEIQMILEADDNLLEEISHYYPEKEEGLNKETRKELKQEYIEKVDAFIEKYKNKEEALKDL